MLQISPFVVFFSPFFLELSLVLDASRMRPQQTYFQMSDAIMGMPPTVVVGDASSLANLAKITPEAASASKVYSNSLSNQFRLTFGQISFLISVHNLSQFIRGKNIYILSKKICCNPSLVSATDNEKKTKPSVFVSDELLQGARRVDIATLL